MDIQILDADERAVLQEGLTDFIHAWRAKDKDDWILKWLGVAERLKPSLDKCSRVVLETGDVPRDNPTLKEILDVKRNPRCYT
ncbi:MAG TPA: hypothetical protein VFR24_27700 [Candidatus Angelobacter sp.]|nr:hypothetical protein [Candidatus Angelobacter sp.]